MKELYVFQLGDAMSCYVLNYYEIYDTIINEYVYYGIRRQEL